MRISDWSSDVCSSDLPSLAACARQTRYTWSSTRSWTSHAGPANNGSVPARLNPLEPVDQGDEVLGWQLRQALDRSANDFRFVGPATARRHRHQRSEEHTSELQSLMRISYAVFCLKKQKKQTTQKHS